MAQLIHTSKSYKKLIIPADLWNVSLAESPYVNNILLVAQFLYNLFCIMLSKNCLWRTDWERLNVTMKW